MRSKSSDASTSLARQSSASESGGRIVQNRCTKSLTVAMIVILLIFVGERTSMVNVVSALNVFVTKSVRE